MKVQVVPVVLVIASLVLSFSFQTATAAAGPAGNWSLTGTPNFGTLGVFDSFQLSYSSNFNVTTTGVVFMVIHNEIGQTVQISVATLQLAAGANGTAYTVVFGLASAEYLATFFVVGSSGVSISTTSTQSFAV